MAATYKLCGIDHRSWGCTRLLGNNERTGTSGCPEKSGEDVQRLFQKLIPKGATVTTTVEGELLEKMWRLEWKRGMSGGWLRLKG